MISITKEEKVIPLDYLREFWPPFVLQQYNQYSTEDIFIAFEALKVLCMKYAGFSKDVDMLLADKKYMYGVLTGILIAMDEFPMAEFIPVEKTTKIRGVMRCYFDLLSEEIGTLFKA